MEGALSDFSDTCEPNIVHIVLSNAESGCNISGPSIDLDGSVEAPVVNGSVHDSAEESRLGMRVVVDMVGEMSAVAQVDLSKG